MSQVSDSFVFAFTLSSSCGTCVRCEGGYVAPTGVCAQEVDRIAEVRDGGYVFIYASEEA